MASVESMGVPFRSAARAPKGYKASGCDEAVTHLDTRHTAQRAEPAAGRLGGWRTASGACSSAGLPKRTCGLFATREASGRSCAAFEVCVGIGQMSRVAQTRSSFMKYPNEKRRLQLAEVRYSQVLPLQTRLRQAADRRRREDDKRARHAQAAWFKAKRLRTGLKVFGCSFGASALVTLLVVL